MVDLDQRAAVGIVYDYVAAGSLQVEIGALASYRGSVYHVWCGHVRSSTGYLLVENGV